MANQAASPTGTAPLPVGPSAGGGGPQGNNTASLPGLWATALLATIISEEERKALYWINEHAQQLQAQADPITGLIAVLQQKQEKCQRNRWHIRVGDRDIILRDVAAKIISVLDVFKAVGDTAVQVDPGAAALPWALIRFLLQAAIEERNQMYALLSIVEGVSRISARCRVYELLFVTGTVSNHAAHNGMQDALVVAYAHILKAIAHTSSRLDQRTIKMAWAAVIRPRETTEIVQELERHDGHVRAAAALCSSVQVHCIDSVARDIKDQLSLGLDGLLQRAADAKGDMQALDTRVEALDPEIKQIQQQISDLDARSESLRGILEKMELPLFRIDGQVSEFLKEVDKERKLRILDWVSKVKFGDHHKSASDSRTPGTCDWLLRDSRFVDWQASSSSVVLLLYGSPGTGKTYLVSRLVDWLDESIQKANSDEAFAFFYCNRNEESRRDHVQVLRSIVRQLAIPRRTNGLDTIHQEIHNHCNVGRETATDLNFNTCMKVLKQFIETYPQTTIVLDALDECEKECRHDLMKLFDDLLSHASRPVKLFIASRPDVDIKEHFMERSFINIRATDNHDDVSKYIQAEVQKHPRWSKLNQGLKTEISSTLLQRSDGMFQWAALQVRQLLRLRTENAIRDRLGRLPKDLKDAYDEIYQEIENLHSDDKQIAHRAFQWVMCAKTPLGRKTLLHAACQDPTSTRYKEPLDEVDENLILDLCHNLLVFDTDLDHWRVSHLSVIEYFEENQLHDVRVAHSNAAKVCLSILLATSMWPKSEWETFQAYRSMISRAPLIEYALLSWQTHVLSLETLPVGEVDEKMAVLLEKFLGDLKKGSPSYAQWHEFAETRHLRHVLDIVVLPGSSLRGGAVLLPPIHFACHLGLFNLLWKWWSSPDLEVDMQAAMDLGGRRNVPSTASWTLLSHAIYMGHHSIARCLLRRGADINIAGEGSWTPLEVAAYRNSTATTLSLLRRGATLVSPEGHASSVIFIATENSSTDVLKMLLSKGVDVKATMAGKGSLLVTAIQAPKNSSLMVKWLIQAGADVTKTSPCKFGSPVAAAAYFGDLKSLRRLLKAGADPQMRIPGNWGSALRAAAASSRPRSQVIQVMKLLIEYGADPNTLLNTGDLGDTSALAIAVYDQAVDAMQFMIQKGADVNMLLPEESHCALIVALRSLEDGHYSAQVMKALLGAGADVNLEPPGENHLRGRRSALGVVFQWAFTGKLYHDPLLGDRPRWMEVAELLVERGAAWYGNVRKLKVGLLRQPGLIREHVESFFSATFLEQLQLNNRSLEEMRSGS